MSISVPTDRTVDGGEPPPPRPLPPGALTTGARLEVWNVGGHLSSPFGDLNALGCIPAAGKAKTLGNTRPYLGFLVRFPS